MIEPMAKIEIVGMFDALDDTLSLLQGLGTIQIEEIPTIEGTSLSHLRRIHLDEGREQLLGHFEEIDQTVTEALGVLADVSGEADPLSRDDAEAIGHLSADEMRERVNPVVREVRRMSRQRKNLQHDTETAHQFEMILQAFLPMLEHTRPSEHVEQIGVIINRGEDAVLAVLRKRVEDIGGPETQVFHRMMPDNRIGVFIVVEKNDLQAVRQFLGNEGVAEYHIPSEFRRDSFRESIESIRDRIDAIPGEVDGINRKLTELKRRQYTLLKRIHTNTANRIGQLRALSRLARTKYTFVISGWAPITEIDRIRTTLSERFGDQVHVGRIRLTDADYRNIPTLLTNRGLFRASEVLMKILPPAKYGNIDATPFIAIFFPFFFGIILGDMAYGLVLLGIAAAIKLRSKKGSLFSSLGTVAVTAALSTILFGFLYGEFLGDFGYRFGLRPIAPWLSREESIEVILIITIGIGVVHILLGYALKIYVDALMRHTKGILEGAAKILLVTGATTVFTQLFLGLPDVVMYVGIAMLGLSVVGIAVLEGIVGILEIFSIFGNILSYSRIMAIGMASVILAAVANRLAEASPHIILAIAIGLVIHSINFAMGLFSPTIHSLRLHYVEFFSKFYVASGKTFKPFKRVGEDIS